MATFEPRQITVSAANDRVAGLVALLPIAEPPAKVRLEPDSITGDPAPGSEARIADPAWMLGRQWQFGELLGEDAGQAVSVRVESRALPVTGWVPLDEAHAELAGDIPWRPWHEGALLEELVQDVPALAFGGGLRQRAEAGGQLVEMLVDAGETGLAQGLAARYPLGLPPDPFSPEEPVPGETAEQRAARLAAVEARDRLDPSAKRLMRVLGGAVPDGGRIAEDTAAGDPAWIGEAVDANSTRKVLAAWREWLLGAPESGGGWSTERLEYRFAIRFGDDANTVVTRGTHFGSAQVRWSDLEWVKDVGGALPAGAPSGTPVDTVATMLATPLRYPGMPADRYWQLEDGAVDLGAIEAQVEDLARICLAEYAMTSGDDWLGVPVDGLLGAINSVRNVRLTDDFGDTTDLTELADPGFSMFQVSTGTGDRLPGIVLPPVAAGMITGPAHEEVLFLRDEMANMAWAIEQTVQGRSGDPRSRSAEPAPPPDPWPAHLDPDERVYRLQTPIPAHWIPLVPIAPVPGQVSLRKGALLRDDVPVEPVGVTLRPTPLTFPGEELPREGVHLRAVPVLARRPDGRYVKWSAYRVRTGRGEASSRLAWDAALSIRSAQP
ncbi:hypothetical protein GA0111570_103342 [Raineyella antarctica]|uniref:Uncharacterized protein n=1 Tax=Raineyella antarctica TaxID=1577474 RepID=A0A1G6GIE6_9ACTN|nr:hypothetical protein [Raineyella antarctica]SDB81782.1 hypothetical protein GA0111570_103342 [Raineyella antarctica]